jgi:hypothetical protein
MGSWPGLRLRTPTGVGTLWAGRRLMLVPGMTAWSSRRLPRLGPGLPAPGAVWLSRFCVSMCVCAYRTAANVRMVMGGARGLAGDASGWSEIDW